MFKPLFGTKRHSMIAFRLNNVNVSPTREFRRKKTTLAVNSAFRALASQPSLAQAKLGRVLLLQGPVGPFFSTLQSVLTTEGLETWRVAFHAGDRLFNRNAKTLHFSSPEIDLLSRMTDDLSIEDFVKYWDSMVLTSFDSTSGILNVEVQAYTAQDAQKIGALVLQYTDELVNELSVAARQDSVHFAEAEVLRAEDRLRAALQQIRNFREQERSINPAVTAQLDIELVSGLESRLIDLRARISSIQGSLDDDAPSLIALRRQAEALEAQISERTAGIGKTEIENGAEIAAMSGLLATYEALEVEKTFAQQVYQSALTSLEQARVEADRQQRYLAVFALPAKPEDALYPKRALSIVMLIAILFSLWGIGTLIVYSVRDHLS